MSPTAFSSHSLSKDEVSRFSRQLILQGFGPRAQERIRNCRVLIVGAGGLGCPVAVYLAAAGVGTIGVVDHDEVSLDNLHRQFLHDECRIGMNKAKSVQESVQRLNSTTNIVPHETLLTPQNAEEIVKDYDIIADCSDNVATRYLVNDVCVLNGKPLVSGSAMGWEGQLTVYNNGPKCPCYRCIFPTPPAPTTVTNCSESGVLGPIVGIIGSLQALEVLRVASRGESPFAGFLWLFDGLEGRTRTICLREKLPSCAICGTNPTVTKLQDYVTFCGASPTDKTCTVNLLPAEERISAADYFVRRQNEGAPLLIDVRSAIEFEICHLPESKNIPLVDLRKQDINDTLQSITNDMNKLPKTVYVVCRRGNDSQMAVKTLSEKATQANYSIQFRDLIGGMEAWASDMDSNFPMY